MPNKRRSLIPFLLGATALFTMLSSRKRESMTGFGPPFRLDSYTSHNGTTGSNTLVIGADFHQPRGKGTTKHYALDFRAKQGTPLYALGDGVIQAIHDPSTLCGQGVKLRMKGQDGHTYITNYCHMSTVSVKKGESVQKGQIIGTTGGTPGTYGAGNSFGPHLHLELWRQKPGGGFGLIDPLPHIDWRPFALKVNHTPGIARPDIIDASS